MLDGSGDELRPVVRADEGGLAPSTEQRCEGLYHILGGDRALDVYAQALPGVLIHHWHHLQPSLPSSVRSITRSRNSRRGLCARPASSCTRSRSGLGSGGAAFCVASRVLLVLPLANTDALASCWPANLLASAAPTPDGSPRRDSPARAEPSA